jgi:hypothetical protein
MKGRFDWHVWNSKISLWILGETALILRFRVGVDKESLGELKLHLIKKRRGIEYWAVFRKNRNSNRDPSRANIQAVYWKMEKKLKMRAKIPLFRHLRFNLLIKLIY